MKRIGILGSTGSIGTQTLEVVDNLKNIRVTALAAGRNIKLLEEQTRKYRPDIVAVYDEEAARSIKASLTDVPVRVVAGMDGLLEMAAYTHMDLMVTGIVGMIGIRPTMEAIRTGKDIALANKETLVTAGHLIMPMAREYGVSILPVDSEHSAIFQCLQGNDGNPIEKILLTASGGPFRGRTREELAGITVEDALAHPTWDMGPKVTIDSSTLANKGLEVMEARWLFDVDPSQIQVVVHPGSYIHSMVQYRDGAILAQIGAADMRLPIQYAITYPRREEMPTKRLDLFEIGQMNFYKPDLETFPALKYAYCAIEAGGLMPTVFNSSNEAAVARFLDRSMSYLEITSTIEKMMDTMPQVEDPDLDEILACEAEVRRRVAEI